MRSAGTFALYSAPLPVGAKDLPAVSLGQSRSALVSATRQMLNYLLDIRTSSRKKQPPRALTPPSMLQRQSLVWIGLVSLLAYGYMHWLPILWPMRFEALRVCSKAADDLGRFWDTHVTEPLKGIAQELFHGYEPTIDPAQVRETRESLVRMLQDFARDNHASGEAGLEEALKRAAAGSMGVVTVAYEEQVKSPMSNLVNGKLLRSLLLIMQQLRLLMEEEVRDPD